MVDPVGLSMVLSSALPATFTFLYQRLDDLLSRYRESQAEAETEVELQVPDVLIGELEWPLNADPDRLKERSAELRAYELGLTHYRYAPERITSEDPLLIRTLGDLRSALEDIYGQRLTFQGEEREQSGPLSEQRLGEVRGEVIGMEAENSIQGAATSRVTAESVEAGGRIIGMKARDIDGTR
ncbi:hypothetical protein AB0M72_22235 [Nocardiopsis dassonvillei]